MRALRRIATPASVAVALGGCTYPFDDYLPRTTDAGLAANRPDTTPEPRDGGATSGRDSGVFEVEDADANAADTTADVAPETSVEADTAATDTATAADSAIADTATTADTLVAEDTHAVPEDAPVDTCACIKIAGGRCKEWWPPGCGD